MSQPIVYYAAGLAVVACGCTHTDLGINAPGHVDLSQPPGNLQKAALEEPHDPGERMIVVGYGGFAGGGFQTGPLSGSYALGPEVSVGYGSRETSHREDDSIVGEGVLADLLQLNVGWSALGRLGGEGVGPLYAEVEGRADGMIGLGGGWTWDPRTRTHGPQVTLNFGPFYSRWTCELSIGSQVTFGVFLKGEHGWVWSR